MARKVGVVRVDLQAGTAEFQAQFAKADTTVRNFGTNAQSTAKNATAAFRTLDGAFPIRSAANFATQVLKLGPILSAAFPVVGALAFGHVLVDMGKHVYDFFKDMEEAPKKIRDAFAEVSGPLHQTNDELRIANDQLDIDIAKLEGRPQNTLKLALDEAAKSAELLGDALEKDLKSIEKIFKDNKTGTFQKWFFGTADTTDIEKRNEKLQNDIHDAQEKLRTSTRQNRARFATDPKGAKEAQDAADKAFRETTKKLYKDAIEYTNGILNESPIIPGKGTIFQQNADTDITGKNKRAKRIAAANALREVYEDESDKIDLSGENEKKKATKNTASVNAEIAKRNEPFLAAVATLKAEISGAQTKLAAIAGTQLQRLHAQAQAESELKITQLENELAKEQHTKPGEKAKLNPVQAQAEKDIRAGNDKKADIAAENAWKDALRSTTEAVKERIASLQLLTDAIGKGYEAQRKANIENRVIEKMGDRYKNPLYKEDEDKYRDQFGKEEDEQQNNHVSTTIDQLNRQIALEKALAEVQAQGAEAVRKRDLEFRIAEARKNAPAADRDDLERKMRDADAAARANESGHNVAALKEETEGYKRLSAAALESAEAIRVANLKNKYEKMKSDGKSQDVIDAQRAADEAEHQKDINIEVEKRTKGYADQLNYIRQLQAAGDHTLETERQRLKLLAQQTILQGNARAGVGAFFLEVQAQARTTAEIVRDTLTRAYESALDGISEQFARFITGQKTSFADLLKSIGTELVKDGIKAEIQKGVGKLASIFHKNPQQQAKPKNDGQSDETALIVRQVGSTSEKSQSPFGDGKPDGTFDNPFYVIVEAQTTQSQSAAPSANALQVIGSAMALIGSLAGGGSDSSSSDNSSGGDGLTESVNSTFKPLMRANGGDVDPGRLYIVGEKEPEFFTPRTSGTITPMSKANLGGDHYHYQIDARGSQLGVENRIARAIDVAQKSAVSSSVRVNHERSLRTPMRKAQ